MYVGQTRYQTVIVHSVFCLKEDIYDLFGAGSDYFIPEKHIVLV